MVNHESFGGRLDIIVGGLACLVAIGGGAVASHIHLRNLAIILVLIPAVVVARQRWGSFVVAAVPFLLPGAPRVDGIVGTLQLAAVTLVLALLHWDAIGRPRIGTAALIGVCVYGVADILQTWGHGLDVQTAAQVALIALAGLLFGASLASNPDGRIGFGWGCVPLALLAIAEILGVHNPWPSLVHETQYVSLSQIPGAGRAQSTFGHPLVAGGCLAGSAAIMLQSRTRYSIPVGILLAVGSVCTVSRSAILGLALALACSILVASQRSRRLGQAAVVIATAVVLVATIPALHQSFITRTVGSQSINLSDQPVRHYAITKLEHDFEYELPSLLLGGGQGSAQASLTAAGGIEGYTIFDDQWITSVYDLGLIPMFVIGCCVLLALWDAPRSARSLGLPAMLALAAVMLFVDGAGWLSLSWLAWVTVGLATAPDAKLGRSGLVDRGRDSQSQSTLATCVEPAA